MIVLSDIINSGNFYVIVFKSIQIIALAAIVFAVSISLGRDVGGDLPKLTADTVFVTNVIAEHNFGFCEPNRKKERIFKSFVTFRRVDKIYMSYKSNVFGFQDSIKNYPVYFNDEDIFLMILNFQPKSNGFFEDTLRIVGTTFRKDTIVKYDTLISIDTIINNGDTSYVVNKKVMKDISFSLDSTVYDSPILLKGYSKLGMEVWADAVKASFDDDSVILRVTARNMAPIVDNYLQERKFNYSFSWSVNADLFYQTGIKYSYIKNSRIKDNRLLLTIEGSNLEIDGTEQVLAEISGKLLLSPVLFSQIIISDVEWNIPWMNTVITNGSLEAEGVCFSQNSRIMFQAKEPFIEIYPNPAGEKAEIEITTTEKGPFGIEIYNLLGRKIRSETLPVYNGEKTENKTYGIHLDGLSDGIYMLTLNTMFHTKTVLFSIQK